MFSSVAECFDFGFDCFEQVLVIQVPAHSGAGIGHDVPVADIYQEALDERPVPAHSRFYRMYAAVLIKENAIAVRPLRQDGPASGKAAVTLSDLFLGNAQEISNRTDILTAQESSTIPFAAFTALRAFERLFI